MPSCSSPENAAAFVGALKLPGGMVTGKQDQPLQSSFADAAMKNGWTQDTYNSAVNWYYAMADAQAAQREEADASFFTDSMTELTSEGGKEFKPNQNAIGNFMNMFPEDFRNQMLLARTPDGRLLDTRIVQRAEVKGLAFDAGATRLAVRSEAGLAILDVHLERRSRAELAADAWLTGWRVVDGALVGGAS